MPGELGQLFENQEELKDPVPAEKIVGTIPNWINGTYIRVGPVCESNYSFKPLLLRKQSLSFLGNV